MVKLPSDIREYTVDALKKSSSIDVISYDNSQLLQAGSVGRLREYNRAII